MEGIVARWQGNGYPHKSYYLETKERGRPEITKALKLSINNPGSHWQSHDKLRNLL